jgi:putative nucleotidyltransferase with HDIG domain
MITKSQEKKMIGIVRHRFIDKEETSGGIGYRFFHSLRTYKICKRFLQLDDVRKLKVDKDALLVAALFHDIGRASTSKKVTDARMPGHEKNSTKMLKRLLKNVINGRTIKKASEIIDHGEADSSFPETMLLNYADEIDSIGALNILRMFTFGTYYKKAIDERLSYWKNSEPQRYNKKWLNAFKINDIKRIAERRAKIQHDFMSEFEKEHECKDIE